jgi:hypothetical protein
MSSDPGIPDQALIRGYVVGSPENGPDLGFEVQGDLAGNAYSWCVVRSSLPGPLMVDSIDVMFHVPGDGDSAQITMEVVLINPPQILE